MIRNPGDSLVRSIGSGIFCNLQVGDDLKVNYILIGNYLKMVVLCLLIISKLLSETS